MIESVSTPNEFISLTSVKRGEGLFSDKIANRLYIDFDSGDDLLVKENSDKTRTYITSRTYSSGSISANIFDTFEDHIIGETYLVGVFGEKTDNIFTVSFTQNTEYAGKRGIAIRRLEAINDYCLRRFGAVACSGNPNPAAEAVWIKLGAKVTRRKDSGGITRYCFVAKI